MTRSNRSDHIRLTSHPVPGAKQNFPIFWGAATARERGPIIGTVSRPQDRNVIGSHGGSFAVYRALAVSSGALDPIRRPRPHQYPPGRDHRTVPAVERSHADRGARSLGPSRRRELPRRDCERTRVQTQLIQYATMAARCTVAKKFLASLS